MNRTAREMNHKRKLLRWKFVSMEEEYEKFFRYNCFQRKWLKLTKDRSKATRLLGNWIQEADESGIDIVVNLVKLLDSTTNPELYLELLEASKVISDRDLSGLSEREIKEAEDLARSIWNEGIFQEAMLIEHPEIENLEDDI